MNKDRVNKVKAYTLELVEHVGENAIPYHITAGELLELLSQVEKGERAIGKLNAIEADETFDKAQEVRDFVDWGQKKEPDYGDLYDTFAGKDKAGA